MSIPSDSSCESRNVARKDWAVVRRRGGCLFFACYYRIGSTIVMKFHFALKYVIALARPNSNRNFGNTPIRVRKLGYYDRIHNTTTKAGDVLYHGPA